MVQVVEDLLGPGSSYTVLGRDQEAVGTDEGLILIPPPIVMDGDEPANVHRGQIYQHYEGAFYTVLEVAESTDPEGRLVVYRHTFTKHGDAVYAKPLKEFIGVVEPPSVSATFSPIRRFTLIFDPDDEEGTMENLRHLLNFGSANRDTSVTLVT